LHTNGGEKDFNLLIIGSGSASFAAAIKATELGKKVAIVEKKTLGGTCVNVGCVPSKTLIRAAESKHRIENSSFLGLDPGQARLNFTKLIEEKDVLVSHLRNAKYASIIEANPNITLIHGRAQFIDSTTVQVGEMKISAERFLIATGGSPLIPDIPGLKESGFLTSTTALELKSLPEHIVVLGGGYIALELSQMFSRLGSKVTILQRSEILFNEDHDISEGLGNYLKAEGVKILDHALVNSVRRKGNELFIEISRRGESLTLKANEILVATGRKPNTKNLGLEAAGVELKPDKTVDVNSYCQTSQPHIYAAGDVLDSPALVYVAAYEGNLAAENAFRNNIRQTDYQTVPWVIFTDPQVAGVGLNEAQAKSRGVEYDVSLLTLDNVPRAIAARDTRGFVKLLRKTGTNELIGARVLAPEGSELIMELSLILRYKIPLTDIASMFHPYLTLSEAVKLAAQTFDKDVKTLSCCAS
jgi:mercuric reductase